MIIPQKYACPNRNADAPRVPFTSLKFGQRYCHEVGGPVSQLFATGESFITIKRDDDWLVRYAPDMEIWNKMVIPYK